MTVVTALPSPGWYPNPADRGTYRYWDGAEWTIHTCASAGAHPSLQPPKAAIQPSSQPAKAVTPVLERRPLQPFESAGPLESRGLFGAYRDVWRNYANFSGRLSVGGYWRFAFANVLIWVGLFLVAGLIAADATDPGAAIAPFLGVLAYAVIMMIPALAANVRRLHDTNRSGWALLCGVIPVVGPLLLFVFSVQRGDAGPNRYGAAPKRRY